MRTHSLAAVTCFFNPCGYKKPVDNYDAFASLLDEQRVPLFTIELAIGDDPFFGSGGGGFVARDARAAKMPADAAGLHPGREGPTLGVGGAIMLLGVNIAFGVHASAG